MENLLLREAAAQRAMVFDVILLIAVTAIALHELHKSLEAKKHPRKRKRKRKDSTWKTSSVRTSVLLLILVTAMGLYLVVNQGMKLHDFHLDRTEGTVVSAQGVITRAGGVKTGKHGSYYRILLDVGEEDKLEIYIHKSLFEGYAFETGATYEVTYYPHSMSLAEAERLE